MTHRAFWIACAATGVLVLVACALPLARLGLTDPHARETVRMLTLGSARSAAVVASGLVLLGVAFAGLRLGIRGPAVLLALLSTLVAFSQAEQSAAYATPDGAIICNAYQASSGVGCGGPVFGPALADLYARHAPVPKSVEAQAQELAYEAKPRPGLWLLFPTPIPLVFWAGYRALRLRIRSPALAVAFVAVLGLGATLLTLLHLAFANYSG